MKSEAIQMQQKYSAWNNDKNLWRAMIDAADEHERLDNYLAGTYGTEGGAKACSVGCSVRSANKVLGLKIKQDSHRGLADAMGVPVFITRLQDRLFEGMASELRPAWTGRLFRAIRPGVDLSPVLPKFLLGLLESMPEQSGDIKKVVDQVKDVLVEWIKTGLADRKAANAAANAAAYAADAANAAYAAMAESLISIINDVCAEDKPL